MSNLTMGDDVMNANVHCHVHVDEMQLGYLDLVFNNDTEKEK